MWEYLIDHPWLLIILASWVVSKMMAKKKPQTPPKQATGTAAPRAALPPKPEAERAGWTKDLEEQIRQAFEQKDTGAARTAVAAAQRQRRATAALPPKPPTKPRPAPAPAPAPTPRQTITPTEISVDDAHRIDYDLNPDAFVFHDTLNETADQEYHLQGFGFRDPLKETTEQEFHLQGFGGFHQAHGLERSPEMFAYQEENLEATPPFFSDPEEIRRAFIITEVFGPPRSQRRRAAGGDKRPNVG